MKNRSTEILLAIVLALAGWNLTETISLGKQVAALQAEIHRLDASAEPNNKPVYVANTDFDRSNSVRGLRDIATAGKPQLLR
jgi:uncharacterized small protein (DUF1192 family)